jgi:hypothetical protein
MQHPSKSFAPLAQLLRRRSEDAPHHPFGDVHPGLAAQAEVVVASAHDADVEQVGVFAAGASVYEGRMAPARRVTWAGEEVRTHDIGIPRDASSVVEGFRLFADHSPSHDQHDLSAAVVSSLSAESTYWTGQAVDALVDGREVTGEVAVFAMSLTAGLFRFPMQFPDVAYDYLSQTNTARLYLDGVYSALGQGDVILIEDSSGVMASLIDAVEVVSVDVAVGGGEEDVTVQTSRVIISPAAQIGHPELTQSVKVWFNARKVGTLERIPSTTVTKADFLDIPRPVTVDPHTPLPDTTAMFIQDAEGTTVRARGAGTLIDDAPHITITELLEDFDGELVKPITFLWGLTKVSRGQTVHREILGSGDSSQPWQSFELAKAPLTYVADPHAPGGRRPELAVFVNGVKWTRALSFYGAGPNDEIYTIRHDDDHQTYVQFGDGELGKRPPTGASNVIATYRFGVGGNVEANTITSLVRPIAGVTTVYNPLPASGGEEPPTARRALERARQDARAFGRVVSLVDFEVEAVRYGGVLRAKAQHAWDQHSHGMVKLWIVCADEGDPSLDLCRYLLKMAEPGVHLKVKKASKWLGALSLDLELDPDVLPQEVHAAVAARLFDEFDGLLAPRNVTIGGAFHRSELYAAIHEIPGVLAVQVFVDGEPMPRVISLAEGQTLALSYADADAE